MNIRNFRDVGGLKAETGTIKKHKILRGGPLHNLDAHTWEELINTYELKTVFDLRTPGEIQHKPNDVIAGVKEVPVDIMSKARASADPEYMVKHMDRRISHQYMQSLNYMFVDRAEAREEFYILFQEILKAEDGAIYIHCSAGKDRTGFAIAQLLKILGVSDDDIMMDYLATNIQTDELVLEELKAIQKNENKTEDELDNIRGFMVVHEDYINAAWNRIDALFGSFDNYVTDVLKLSKKDIEKLKSRYIE